MNLLEVEAAQLVRPEATRELLRRVPIAHAHPCVELALVALARALPEPTVEGLAHLLELAHVLPRDARAALGRLARFRHTISRVNAPVDAARKGGNARCPAGLALEVLLAPNLPHEAVGPGRGELLHGVVVARNVVAHVARLEEERQRASPGVVNHGGRVARLDRDPLGVIHRGPREPGEVGLAGEGRDLAVDLDGREAPGARGREDPLLRGRNAREHVVLHVHGDPSLRHDAGEHSRRAPVLESVREQRRPREDGTRLHRGPGAAQPGLLPRVVAARRAIHVPFEVVPREGSRRIFHVHVERLPHDAAGDVGRGDELEGDGVAGAVARRVADVSAVVQPDGGVVGFAVEEEERELLGGPARVVDHPHNHEGRVPDARRRIVRRDTGVPAVAVPADRARVLQEAAPVRAAGAAVARAVGG
mmetsp:Transcript_43280/g.102973  ORF Transcript_43280/g.102973 Transcript_43280/m.102973 type:complete len:420 (-) Transcript_43280:574-1833(-)